MAKNRHFKRGENYQIKFAVWLLDIANNKRLSVSNPIFLPASPLTAKWKTNPVKYPRIRLYILRFRPSPRGAPFPTLFLHAEQ